MDLLLLYFFLAIGISFICSILEAVLLSVNYTYITMMEKTHPSAGRQLRVLKSDIDRPLSAILSLNTVAHTIGAAGVGAQAQMLFGNAYMAITSVILTLAILILSEIIPKTLGASYWRALAPLSAWTLKWMVLLMYPLVVLSKIMTRLIVSDKRVSLFSREEFSAQIELGIQEGIFKEKESRIFQNLIRFGSLRAGDIMTPRIVVIAFDENQIISDIKRDVEKLRVSRIPVYKDTFDNVTGYVLKNDLLIRMARNDLNHKLYELRRDIPVLPDLLRLDKLFAALLEKQEHIAVLVDEYGRLAGLVTLEDVVETLLGSEIVDEVDTVRDMQVLARQRWEERAKRLGLVEMSEEIKQKDSTASLDTDSSDE